MSSSDFARAVTREINRVTDEDHAITIEPTSEGAGAPDSARWFCSCGDRSVNDYLFPPTAEKRAAEHLSVATGSQPSGGEGRG